MEKKNKKETVDKFEMIKINKDEGGGKKGGKKGAAKPKTTAAKKGKKGKDESMELDSFIDESDDEPKKKKGPAKSTGAKGKGKK